MTITIPSGRTLPLKAKTGGGFESAIESPAGNILVSGTGFGTRNASYDHYINYNDQPDGTLTEDMGYQATGSGSTVVVPSVQSNDAHDGGKSLEGTYQATGNSFPKIRRDFTGIESIYAAFWFKWTAPPGAGPIGVFKLFRSGNEGYSGFPRAVDTIRSTGDGIATSMDASVFLEVSPLDAVGNRTDLKHANQWHFCEYYYRLSTPGVADGEYRGWVNGQLTFGESNLLTRELAESRITFFINMFDGRDIPSDSTGIEMTVRQSDEYASESRARVIITDAPIYANSTTWQIQPVVSWTDTSIEVERQPGALPAGTNYLYAWDENDNLVVDAHEVTI